MKSILLICKLKVGIHLFSFQVRNLSYKFIYGKLLGIVLVGIQSYRINFCVIEANVTICNVRLTYKQFYLQKKILEYQFHSEVEKVRSLYKVPLLQFNAGLYSTSLRSSKIILTKLVPLQFAKFSLEMNHKKFSSISTMKYSRPSSILLKQYIFPYYSLGQPLFYMK
ncbi:Hypothetical_protein [Hexamita inflata]|uniref:Hypothetical_protein n=1 Tax=Hexamita inflata TaxID=28002 RepID=A0AA86RD22_9EUKA|nr:Hypothetical protein HINF_LOCUS58463 [Hexamita inflata]